MKNKGFSLVELIIVIAIMAILAAAIAPALIRYIDKSRKADDLTAGGTINSAVSAALANEDAYDDIQAISGAKIIAFVSKNTLDATGGGTNFSKELSNNLDQRVSPKYKKENQACFIVYLDAQRKITVAIADSASDTGHLSSWQMQPSIGSEYK
ncbi:MAG: prepilin-type N-terminal cleavage/methylation domain-containing protein [Eubacterium sp.]|nr:prepilin-type N-terminal cleavage/methylation domain-containing protein [Eubacterium sp.]